MLLAKSKLNRIKVLIYLTDAVLCHGGFVLISNAAKNM